eukprot:SAG25_NODE_43_length_19261_cov_111.931218_5_plen_144_part_00
MVAVKQAELAARVLVMYRLARRSAEEGEEEKEEEEEVEKEEEEGEEEEEEEEEEEVLLKGNHIGMAACCVQPCRSTQSGQAGHCLRCSESCRALPDSTHESRKPNRPSTSICSPSRHPSGRSTRTCILGIAARLQRVQRANGC